MRFRSILVWFVDVDKSLFSAPTDRDEVLWSFGTQPNAANASSDGVEDIPSGERPMDGSPGTEADQESPLLLLWACVGRTGYSGSTSRG